MPIDKFRDALLTPREAARHLQLPPSTLSYWLRDQAAGEALVHRVPPAKRGWPSVPFIAVIEAYVLRSLRDLGLSKKKIRDAAAAVRREFNTEYGLATQRIATDGIDIFVSYADGDLVRAHDGQAPIRDIIDRHLRYITWDEVDGSPARLTLQQYPDLAPVVIDPRFGWGAPVISTNNVQVDMVVKLWRAGESLDAVAEEYGLTRDVAEAICRIAA
ncbi:MAG: DUF433 domain-containing protein [Candidatus Dormibacteria bacterium]